MVVDLFAEVKNKNVESPEWKEHPFGEDQLQMKGFVVPVKDIRNLNITFSVPDMRKHYETQVFFINFFIFIFFNLNQTLLRQFNYLFFGFPARALPQSFNWT